MYFDCFCPKTSKLFVLALASTACLLPYGAQAQASSAPAFTPSKPWEVAATELVNVRGLAGTKMPCVLSNEYDNGFVVRLSGGGQKMLAMAVDFRQDVFAKGQQYSSMLSLGSGYVKQVQATAFTPSTLIFNLREMGDFYAQLSQQKWMDISVDKNDFRFSLEGIGSRFAALESCYNGEKTQIIKPLVSASSATAKPPVDEALKMPASLGKEPVPRTFDEIIAGSDAGSIAGSPPTAVTASGAGAGASTQKTLTPLPGDVAASGAAKSYVANIPGRVSREVEDAPAKAVADGVISSPAVAATPAMPQLAPSTAQPIPTPPTAPAAAPKMAVRSTTPPVPAPQTFKWTGFAGETVRSVLARWSVDAGYNLEWQSNSTATLPQDVSLNGSFEEAVNQILAEAGASEGMAATIKDAPPSAMPDQAQKTQDQSAAWQANKGANIQDVINLWAAREDVKVVWEAFTSLPVKNSQSSRGSFESALQSLLDQYEGDSVRPFATLNEDPRSGQKTLTMTMER